MHPRARASHAWSRLAVLAFLLLHGVSSSDGADKDKKEVKKPEPPRIVVTVPLAVTAGATNLVRARGTSLADVTEVRFTNEIAQASLRLKSASKLDVPRDQDARKVGDTQLELECYLPPEAAPGTHHLAVTSTNGTSPPHALLVVAPGTLTEEKEPNGGREKAQILSSGAMIQGSLREEADVDVFRIEGRPGQWLVAEVRAARLGSALDPVLTLYDIKGAILAESDDAPGHRDAVLRFQLPAGGAACYLSLVDALHRGGPAYVYLLSVKLE